MLAHLEGMTLPKPANDDTPPLWPGLSRHTEERIGFWFSLAVLAVGFGFMLAVLDARHWTGIGLTVAVGFVFMLIAEFWRLLMGR